MANNALEQKDMDFRQSLFAAANLQTELTSVRKILAALSEREVRQKAEVKQAMQDIAALKHMVLKQTQRTLAAEQNATKVIKENRVLRAKITTIYSSTSWRITGPLRNLKYLLKRKVR